MARQRPRVTAAVCAYNEAANIGRLLQVLFERDGGLLDEVIVVSSGSTDGTDDIVREAAGRWPKLRLLTEERRNGKSRAVNLALSQAAGGLVLLIDADCLPGEGALAAMLAHFEDQGVGGVGARNVVLNRRESWVARMAAVLWDLHHQVNLLRPVLGGDIIAFLNTVPSVPEATVNDDYAIEAALRAQGLRIEYEPRAEVLMRAPSTLSDYLRQRRRIAAGFRTEAAGKPVKATQDAGLVLRAALRLASSRPACLPWLLPLFAAETWARADPIFRALLRLPSDYTAWEPAATTKLPLGEPDVREQLS
jgi:biofilm PGA synthesis N-glycosyltransferase PgaC